MPNKLKLNFEISGDDYTRAGEASAQLKKTLRKLGLPPQIVRRAAIAMYEGEINMVIHADGGSIDVEIDTASISLTLADKGPGIPEVSLAMKEGYSTASEKVRSMGFGAGMGLPNMRRHTDYMKIDSTLGVGTTVHMKIAIVDE